MARSQLKRGRPFPSSQPIEVLSPGELVTDRFGNQRREGGIWVQVVCFAWFVAPVAETHEDSVLRTVDTLTVYVPVETSVDEWSQVRLPDGSVWHVDGHAENYENNPFFNPGLVVVKATKVEG